MDWMRKGLIGLGLVFGVWSAQAQLGPVECMPEWGQAGWSNPALLHPSGGQLWIGGLAGSQIGFSHSGPSAYDFMSADGVVDPSLMLERMDSVETIGFRAEVPLFALSFRDKNRFEFRLRSRFVADQQFNYDRDLFAMGWKGNGHPDMIGRPISFSDFGLNAQGYFDHSLSVGAMVTEEKFWLGWGVHILNGVGAFETETFDATWYTDSVDYSWTLEGEAAVQSAGVDLDSLVSNADPLTYSGGGVPPILGSGVAFDVGFLWRVSPKFSLEGAMEGRGSIRWLKSISKQQVDPAQFVLQGMDVVGLLSRADSLSLPDSLPAMFDTWASDMADSLQGAFELDSKSDEMPAFSTPVQETWRLGFRIRPSESIEITGMAYRQFRFDRRTDGFLLGLTHRLGTHVATHVQAQFRDQSWSFGAGLSLRGGPLRIAASAQNVPGLLYPLESGHWQGQFGIGFEMGYKKEKQKRRKSGQPATGKGMWH